MGADQILVLNGGRVEELGSHSQLIQNHGIYRQIYEIQMRRDDRKQIEYGGESEEEDSRTDVEKRTGDKEVQCGSI